MTEIEMIELKYSLRIAIDKLVDAQNKLDESKSILREIRDTIFKTEQDDEHI